MTDFYLFITERQSVVTQAKVDFLKESAEDKRLRREATEKYRDKKLKVLERLADALTKK